jgi:hypothetical protein
MSIVFVGAPTIATDGTVVSRLTLSAERFGDIQTYPLFGPLNVLQRQAVVNQQSTKRELMRDTKAGPPLASLASG